MTVQTADDPMAGFALERPAAMRTRVSDYLRSQIANGSLPRGTRLVETELAEAIGVSRTPIREALHALEREGLVESLPRVGYRVREIEWEEVEQVCEIRTVNEVLAARWVLDRLNTDVLARLEANVAACEAAVASGEIGRIAELDGEFHEILVGASGSNRLLEICQNLRHHMVLFRMETFRDHELARMATVGHRQIVECLKAGDVEAVEEAVRSHLQDAKRSIGQVHT